METHLKKTQSTTLTANNKNTLTATTKKLINGIKNLEAKKKKVIITETSNSGTQTQNTEKMNNKSQELALTPARKVSLSKNNQSNLVQRIQRLPLPLVKSAKVQRYLQQGNVKQALHILAHENKRLSVSPTIWKELLNIQSGLPSKPSESRTVEAIEMPKAMNNRFRKAGKQLISGRKASTLFQEAGAKRRNALINQAKKDSFNSFVEEINKTLGVTKNLYKIHSRVDVNSNLNNNKKAILKQKISNSRFGTLKRNIAKAESKKAINRITSQLAAKSLTVKILTPNHKTEANSLLVKKRQNLKGQGPALSSAAGLNYINTMNEAQLKHILGRIEGRKQRGQPLNRNALDEKRILARLRPKGRGILGKIGGVAKAVGGVALKGAVYLGQQGAKRGFNVTVGRGQPKKNNVQRLIKNNRNIAAVRKAYQQSVGGNASENAVSVAGALSAFKAAASRGKIPPMKL